MPKPLDTSRIEVCAHCGRRVPALEMPAVWEGKTVCGRCFEALAGPVVAPPRRPWWRRRATIIATGLVVIGVLAASLWPASYARRTEPVYRALMRMQADVEASAPDAAFRADLSAADAAAARWSGSLSPAERRRHSCQYFKQVLAAYDALPRHRAEASHGEQAKDWDLVDDAQRGIDNALRWAPQTLAEARAAVDAGD